MTEVLLVVLLFLMVPYFAWLLVRLERRGDESAARCIPVGSYWRYAVEPNDYPPVRVIGLLDGRVVYAFTGGMFSALDASAFLSLYSPTQPPGDCPQPKE